MSDYIPTGDGWIAGPPAVDAGPVEVVRYAVASPAAETDAAAPAEQVWHRPLPGLPTAPGYYLAAAPLVVELLNSPAGQWVDAADLTYRTEQEIRDLGPLQRLVTAAELLEQVRQAITALGALDGDAKAAIYTALDEIEDSYGVNG